ncbi:DNA endonuclease SmrA [Marinobacterium sediminicola]|uniref:DNA-nicking endonuclease, Smr domain n=1 Tax=Marinobacterium sediminicola TaxID=518898 RepID=A0ABY1RWD6_9GAMM|nr:DNA endonuclease SmrA [Marinobacterium sediminicola]ULG70342.1 DNA endonuclease SmrA [Marinobacterium sediminicola]SMR69687.1 DNA-nicking endonuclease, Smr domain [Marinobacterium sediminicola]
MRSDNDTDFSTLMQAEGVRRNPAAKPVEEVVSRGPLKVDPGKSIRRLLAQGSPEGLTLSPVEWLHPADPISWKRDGVQEGVFRNLRLGRYSTDACLNLQHCTLAQAREEVASFVRQSCELNIRTVLIQHGRSNRADGHGNQLKTYLNEWLPLLDQVLGFHSSQPHHGGNGAIYVMLRKSDQARQDNWEQHQKRR